MLTLFTNFSKLSQENQKHVRNILEYYCTLYGNHARDDDDQTQSISDEARALYIAAQFSLGFYNKTEMLPGRQILWSECDLPQPKKEILDLSEEEVLYHAENIRRELHSKEIVGKTINLQRSTSMEDLRTGVDDLSQEINRFTFEDAIEYAPFSEMRYEVDKEEHSRSDYFLTGIDCIDKKLGSVLPGTTETWAGGTSMYKSTAAYNAILRNCCIGQLKGLFFSLEVPREHAYWHLLARHAYHMNGYADSERLFSFNHLKERTFTEEQLEFLSEVEKDFHVKTDGYLRVFGPDASIPFDKISFGALIDSLYRSEPFDYFILDYIQLTKYYNTNPYIDQYTFMNNLVSVIRHKSTTVGNGAGCVSIILSQCNREGVNNARRHNSKQGKVEGQYTLNALAEGNELERSSQVVIFFYSNDILHADNEVKYQLLKNRDGALIETPQTTTVLPEYSFIGDTCLDDEMGRAQRLDLSSSIDGEDDFLDGAFESDDGLVL